MEQVVFDIVDEDDKFSGTFLNSPIPQQSMGSTPSSNDKSLMSTASHNPVGQCGFMSQSTFVCETMAFEKDSSNNDCSCKQNKTNSLGVDNHNTSSNRNTSTNRNTFCISESSGSSADKKNCKNVQRQGGLYILAPLFM
jgi:hypothetical protein